MYRESIIIRPTAFWFFVLHWPLQRDIISPSIFHTYPLGNTSWLLLDQMLVAIWHLNTTKPPSLAYEMIGVRMTPVFVISYPIYTLYQNNWYPSFSPLSTNARVNIESAWNSIRQWSRFLLSSRNSYKIGGWSRLQWY